MSVYQTPNGGVSTKTGDSNSCKRDVFQDPLNATKKQKQKQRHVRRVGKKELEDLGPKQMDRSPPAELNVTSKRELSTEVSSITLKRENYSERVKVLGAHIST